MDYSKIYVGMPVKTTKDENIWEILRIDDYSMSVWCRPINSIDFELKEFKIEELKEV
ncbi:MAG: hypothetical protein LIR50_05875 [Bacillota bacterium]|nr:hypothetical protein [Bacillota bacterium]